MSSRQDIVREARSWIGTKFIHQARLKGAGVDCAGIIEQIAVTFNLQPSDYVPVTNYPKDPTGVVEKILRRNMVQVNLDQLKEGCVLFFGFGVKLGQHLAIYTDKNTIIHAYEPAGKVIETTYSGIWVQKTLAVFDYKGIT